MEKETKSVEKTEVSLSNNEKNSVQEKKPNPEQYGSDSLHELPLENGNKETYKPREEPEPLKHEHMLEADKLFETSNEKNTAVAETKNGKQNEECVVEQNSGSVASIQAEEKGSFPGKEEENPYTETIPASGNKEELNKDAEILDTQLNHTKKVMETKKKHIEDKGVEKVGESNIEEPLPFEKHLADTAVNSAINSENSENLIMQVLESASSPESKDDTHSTKGVDKQKNSKKVNNSFWDVRRAVFVDPLDKEAKYWWAAMIVPKNEIDSSMNCGDVGEGECVVRYFEDNKFSAVSYSELKVFNPKNEPFITFENKYGQEFLNDAGIQSALNYINTDTLPQNFMWSEWAKKEKVDKAKKRGSEDELETHSNQSTPPAIKSRGGEKRVQGRNGKGRGAKNAKGGGNREDYSKTIQELEKDMSGLHEEYMRVLRITSQLAKELWIEQRKGLPSGLAITRQGKRRRYI
ncbi:hypothetical protein AX774_g6591 [Zancudomyces culisetae]|uniref:ARID4A/B PWWP domain-containing protein n=1 Tax=Zancudomyces culisetae TaxID=1213189 RepID=A0A1R1PG60_ZANCU|nr:hypothetical protein AX774_g6591 [Zancudomyces culisetae]|eukprot:OMH79975.1 hypothetical protein AX774_g6591 [Zancudomyces culisetae]